MTRFHDGGIVRPETAPVIAEGCSYPMPDYLARAIAAEDDADHCGDCAAEARRQMHAECEHDSYVELLTLCSRLGEHLPRLCNTCGLAMLEAG